MEVNAESELELVTDLMTFDADPLAFVLYAYPWGEEGTPLANFDGPRKWQEQVLVDIRDFTQEQKFRLQNDMPVGTYKEATRSGRGPGKSALLGWLSHWNMSTHLGSSTLVTANTEGQLRSKTFPEFGRWFTLGINAHWFEVDSLRIYPKEWLAELARQQLKIDTGYWNITAQNWSEENPDAFAGTHNTHGLFVLFDEASGIPEPIWKVTNGFFTESTPYRLWIAFSNPRRNAGAFYNRCEDPRYDATWRRRKINCLDIPEVSKGTYHDIIAEEGEYSDTARVEVYGEFPEQGTDQFISSAVVRASQQRELLPFDDSQPVIMGVDPAPRGRTAIRFRQGRDARSIEPTILRNKDNQEIADEIVRLIDRHDPDAIAIDAGNGTGVIDELKRRKIRVFEVWFGSKARDKPMEFANLGTELWGAIRDWLPGACIDANDDLFRDLTARPWKWHGREEGQKILVAKRDMAREGIPSPDDADALACTFYPKVSQRRRATRRHSGVKIASGLDYDILGLG